VPLVFRESFVQRACGVFIVRLVGHVNRLLGGA
jgi:hypothetical protein